MVSLLGWWADLGAVVAAAHQAVRRLGGSAPHRYPDAGGCPAAGMMTGARCGWREAARAQVGWPLRRRGMACPGAEAQIPGAGSTDATFKGPRPPEAAAGRGSENASESRNDTSYELVRSTAVAIHNTISRISRIRDSGARAAC
jgi:hypothetical protein